MHQWQLYTPTQVCVWCEEIRKEKYCYLTVTGSMLHFLGLLVPQIRRAMSICSHRTWWPSGGSSSWLHWSRLAPSPRFPSWNGVCRSEEVLDCHFTLSQTQFPQHSFCLVVVQVWLPHYQLPVCNWSLEATSGPFNAVIAADSAWLSIPFVLSQHKNDLVLPLGTYNKWFHNSVAKLYLEGFDHFRLGTDWPTNDGFPSEGYIVAQCLATRGLYIHLKWNSFCALAKC